MLVNTKLSTFLCMRIRSWQTGKHFQTTTNNYVVMLTSKMRQVLVHWEWEGVAEWGRGMQKAAACTWDGDATLDLTIWKKKRASCTTKYGSSFSRSVNCSLTILESKWQHENTCGKDELYSTGSLAYPIVKWVKQLSVGHTNVTREGIRDAVESQ